MLRMMEVGNDNRLTRKRSRKDTSDQAGRYGDCYLRPILAASFHVSEPMSFIAESNGTGWSAFQITGPARIERSKGRTSMEDQRMQPFYEMKAHHLTSSTLQEEIKSRGYALIRELLPHDDVTRLLREITQILSVAGWL